MLGLQRHRRIGQQQSISGGFAVNPLSRCERAQNRPRAAGIDRDIGTAGQFTNPARIALGLSQGQISCDRDQAEDLQFLGCRQRQQDRDGIVEAGVGIDDDPAPHRRVFIAARTD